MTRSSARRSSARSTHALNNIPLIKRATIGRRIVMGRQYDDQNAAEFPFVAILEFELDGRSARVSRAPAHEALGMQFYTTSEAALAYDFELLAPAQTGEVAGLKAVACSPTRYFRSTKFSSASTSSPVP